MRQLYSISSNKATKADESQPSEYGYVPIRWHTKRAFMFPVVMFICNWDSPDPRGYRMDRMGILRRPADSACI